MTAAVARRGRFVPQGNERPHPVDVALALGLAIFAQLDLRFNLDNSTHYGSDFATGVVVATATLVLAGRRRWPLATLGVVVAATAVPELFTRLTVTLWGHFVPLLIATYSLARWCANRRAAAVGAMLAVATIVVQMVRVPSVGTVSNIPFTLVPIACAFAVGHVLRQRQLRHTELADRATRLELDRDAQIRAAVADERSRIARELHDIIAHCVTVMVVQAGASEELIDRHPEQARQPLQAVQETGRLAIAELSRMLGLLRGADRPPVHGIADLEPQPGVAQLPELAERMSTLGLPVQLTVSGDARPLAPGVELTAYRVVQEALTNTLKHGGEAVSARVELRFSPHSLTVEVTDDGTCVPTMVPGHGLIGMAERASTYGGTVDTGPMRGGGFRVHLVLPLDPA